MSKKNASNKPAAAPPAPDAAPAPPVEPIVETVAVITEEEISAKVRESLGGLSREQARTVIATQRAHDDALAASAGQ